MKVGTGARYSALADMPGESSRAESLGYDFFNSNETNHNAFLPIVLAA